MPSVVKDEADYRHNVIAQRLQRAERVVLLHGAGISCNAGIPDFRSEYGLRSTSIKKALSDLHQSDQGSSFVAALLPDTASLLKDITTADLNRKAVDLFERIHLSTTSMFLAHYRLFFLLYHRSRIASPTVTHGFAYQLKRQGKLARCFTQNFDTLEYVQPQKASTRTEPLLLSDPQPSDDIIYLHGRNDRLCCNNSGCDYISDWSDELARKLIVDGLALCPACTGKSESRQARGSRKLPVGRLGPNVVLYGDPTDEGLISTAVAATVAIKPDLMIILGTSLRVPTAQSVLREISKAVNDHFAGMVLNINLAPSTSVTWDQYIDHCVLQDCDLWVTNTLRRVQELTAHDFHPPPHTAMADSVNGESDEEENQILEAMFGL